MRGGDRRGVERSGEKRVGDEKSGEKRIGLERRGGDRTGECDREKTGEEWREEGWR